MSNFWDFSTLADQLLAILTQAESDLRLEQAVYGLDKLDELQLQTLLASGLCRWYCVAREAHYPSTAGRKLSHRPRCDLVLSPPANPLRVDRNPPGLFDPPDSCPPHEALWLEVKTARQFTEGGLTHRGYSGQWRQAIVADLVKMENEPTIHQAGLLLVVFTESQAIIDKDLELFETLLAQKEVLAGFRHSRSLAIQERIGHHLCTVTLWPTLQRG